MFVSKEKWDELEIRVLTLEKMVQSMGKQLSDTSLLEMKEDYDRRMESRFKLGKAIIANGTMTSESTGLISSSYVFENKDGKVCLFFNGMASPGETYIATVNGLPCSKAKELREFAASVAEVNAVKETTKTAKKGK